MIAEKLRVGDDDEGVERVTVKNIKELKTSKNAKQQSRAI
jgi:hypothetical protein